jgi:hypothetical protein
MMKPPVILPEGKQYHVFFVYRTVVPDKDWVKEIARSLETSDSGLKCAYHERDFFPGWTIFDVSLPVRLPAVSSLPIQIGMTIKLVTIFPQISWHQHIVLVANSLVYHMFVSLRE